MRHLVPAFGGVFSRTLRLRLPVVATVGCLILLVGSAPASPQAQQQQPVPRRMTAEDSERALKALRQRAESGDAEAQVNIAAAAFLAPSFAAMILRRRARRGASQAAPDLRRARPSDPDAHRGTKERRLGGRFGRGLRLEPPRRSALNDCLDVVRVRPGRRRMPRPVVRDDGAVRARLASRAVLQGRLAEVRNSRTKMRWLVTQNAAAIPAIIANQSSGAIFVWARVSSKP